MKDTSKWLLRLDWRPKQQDERRFSDERQDTEEDETRDEERADRIGDVPSKVLDEQRRNDDADTAEGVGKNMEENTWNGKVNRNGCTVCGDSKL